MDAINGFWFTYVILPVLIILARIIDQALGTIKIVFISKGNIKLSPILGFFEVLIWLIAISRIFDNLDNPITYVAYALGYALGSLIGLKIEQRLAIGVQLIRIITRKNPNELIGALRLEGYNITTIKAEGSTGEVGILYSVVNRKNISEFVSIIKETNPNAFYTIEDIRYVSQSINDMRKIDPNKKRSYSIRK